MGTATSKLNKERGKVELEHERANKQLEITDKYNKLNADNERQKMEFENEAAIKKLNFENEAAMKKLNFENEAAAKQHDLDKIKAELEHQHKITELIAQMKQSKLQSGKDILLTYMDTIKIIIQQNSNLYQTIDPLLNQVKDEKLPKKIRDAIENSIEKTLQGFMGTRDLLDYAKEQMNELQLKQNNEFLRLLGTAVKQKVMTESDRIYLLDEGYNSSE